MVLPYLPPGALIVCTASSSGVPFGPLLHLALVRKGVCSPHPLSYLLTFCHPVKNKARDWKVLLEIGGEEQPAWSLCRGRWSSHTVARMFRDVRGRATCYLSVTPGEAAVNVGESLLMDWVLTLHSSRASPRTSRCPRAAIWATSRTMKERR